MRTIYMPSNISKDKEEELFKNGLFVFDTCGLLDFYYLTRDYQEIMAEIINYLKTRIWIPAQVKYEFDNNYASARMKPISEMYNDHDLQKNSIVREIKTYIDLWKKKYYHPYISAEGLQSIEKHLSTIEPIIAEIKTTIAKEYQQRNTEIKDSRNNDVIKLCVDSLDIGSPFSFKELKSIITEGMFRYKNLIPPGYKDAEDKHGIRQYGDLIIWKEILRKAKDAQKDIVFISNDLKADWRIVDETAKEKNPYKPNVSEKGNPRRELLTEFEEETGREIWFYTSSEFIEKLEEFFKPNQPQLEFYDKLGVVRDVMEQRNRERNLKTHHSEECILVRCGKCGELFEVHADELEFDWEGGLVQERGMGPENEYISEEVCTCPNCNNQIDISLQVWEYPMGVFNFQNIEIDGGDIEKPISLSSYISFNEYEACCRCGDHAILNEIGLCDACQEEYDRFVNSDD